VAGFVVDGCGSTYPDGLPVEIAESPR